MAERRIDSVIENCCKSYGYSELKKEQRDILRTFLNGKDVFGCLPTGFGKSLCYMLLPKAFDLLYNKTDGTSIIIVISPLTSLMDDQVESCVSRGIKAIAVTREEESKKKYASVVNGFYQIVYMSPEMIIGTRKWQATLQDDEYQSRLCGVVIDEAHCVKKW